MSFHPFETEILERFGSYGTALDVAGQRGWKGIWVRGYLASVRQDYPYAIYTSWMRFCKKAFDAKVVIKPGTYQAFRTYFYILSRLGLVTLTTKRRKVSGEPGSGKHYYMLTPGREADSRWGSPMQELYPSTDWVSLSAAQKQERRKKYSRSRPSEV